MIVRSQQELLFCCFCDHVSPNITKLWLLLLPACPVSTASPSRFHFNTHPEEEPCIRYVCVLPTKPFFLPVDIRHTQCPCRFVLLERHKFCGHKTTTTQILHTLYCFILSLFSPLAFVCSLSLRFFH